MSARPHAGELLAVAREAFLRDILPHLPEDRRYTALMVASAIGIAARDAEARAGEESAELAMLAWLYGEDETRRAGRSDEERRARLRSRLAGDIREGRLDRMLQGRLRALLMERSVARLRISNPKYLHAAGIA